MSAPVSIFWFRRDLRLADNTGLYHALSGEWPVVPLFIFDTDILDGLEDRQDARLTFIHDALQRLNKELEAYGSRLVTLHGRPEEVWAQLLEKENVQAVYTNHDYEPYARQRDAEIKSLLAEKGIPFYTFKDQVIFEKDEVVKEDGSHYTVFTPYGKKWRARLVENPVAAFPSETKPDKFAKLSAGDILSLEEIGFQPSGIVFPSAKIDQGIITNYEETRNFPAIAGSSRMGVHLRFGTVSVRQLVKVAQQCSDTYLNELIWREFFMMLLWHNPHMVNQEAKAPYRNIAWRYDEEGFQRWCEGRTGFPLVDAGMRELNATGFMHNRVRMVVASFLCKDLLIDWRWGEAYFAEKLLDYEQASNVGNWQWAAGTGFDAAPYFRIFNPESQAKKFDPKGIYIKKWVPEYGTPAYPKPMVRHEAARERALIVYKTALKER